MKKFTLFLSLLFVGFQAFAGEFDHEKTLELYNLARKEQETTDEKQNQAFEKKLLQEADELLAQGANPNYPISPIDSTIFCALENGHTGLVEKLIKHGASLPEAIHLPFFKEKGFNASCITDLYSLGKKENLRSCRRTWNALHLAAFLGHEELVKWLLKNNPNLANKYDINEAGEIKSNATPLAIALFTLSWAGRRASRENYRNIIALLAQGTNVALFPGENLTVADAGLIYDFLPVNLPLAQEQKQLKESYNFSFFAKLDFKRLYRPYDKDFSTNVWYEKKDTERNWRPLHVATYFGAINVIKHLLKNGADPLEQDSFGMSALDLITCLPARNDKAKKYPAIAEELIKAAKAKDPSFDVTPYAHQAIARGNLKVFEQFVENDKTLLHKTINPPFFTEENQNLPQAKNNSTFNQPKWTALHLACYTAQTKIVEYLLNRGKELLNQNENSFADFVNKQDAFGNTALHIAYWGEKRFNGSNPNKQCAYATIKSLLTKNTKIKIAITNQDGLTAESYAEQTESLAIKNIPVANNNITEPIQKNVVSLNEKIQKEKQKLEKLEKDLQTLREKISTVVKQNEETLNNTRASSSPNISNYESMFPVITTMLEKPMYNLMYLSKPMPPKELIPLQEPIATTQTTTNSSQEGKVTEEATTETEELSAKQITEGSEVINEEPKATEKITTIIQTPTAKTEEPEPIANTQTTSNPTKQKPKEMVIPVKPDKFRPIEQPANSQDFEENHTQKKPKQTSQSSWLSTLTHAAASVVKTVVRVATAPLRWFWNLLF